MRRSLTVLTVVASLSASLLAHDAAADWDAQPLGGAVTSQHDVCGDRDLREGDIQGHIPTADQDSGRAEKGYNCGLALVGHATLGRGGRPPSSNANMAWAGHCAYVAGPGGGVVPQMYTPPPAGSGVAVVSVSSKGQPTHVGTLRRPGAAATSETINATTTPEGRSILVVGQYGNDVVANPKPMDVYDVSDPDCRKWKHIPNPDFPNDATKATYYWPANIHNLTVSQNGKYVFATIPLQAVDISGLWDSDPKTGVTYLGNLNEAMEGPELSPGPYADYDDSLPAPVREAQHPQLTSHEAWPSADGTRVYVGSQTPEAELLTILDLTQWLQRDAAGNPKGKPVVLSQRSGRAHSVRTAKIGGVPYLLHSEESVFGTAYGCVPETANPFAGPAQPWLTNIADPRHPKLVSQMGLEINEPANCPAQLDSGANQSVHYHDVDNPDDTTFVMASMWNAGLRIFDVRNPKRPTQVAYFNPGDVDPSDETVLDHAWAHVRYLPETGQIWFTTAAGGFWVVRIEGKLRKYLDLDKKNRARGLRPLNVPTNDRGRPGTVGARLVVSGRPLVDTAPWYCTLSNYAVPLAISGRAMPR